MANLVNREAVQKLCATSYLDDYLDCMQNLPNQLQPYLSRIRELDVESDRFMKQIEHLRAQLSSTKNGTAKGKDSGDSGMTGSRRSSSDGDAKDLSEDSADSKSHKKDSHQELLRRNLETAMEELGDVVQQKLAAASKMAEVVECRRRMLDEGLDSLHNCDQADSSLFSPGLSPNFGKSRPDKTTGQRNSPTNRGASRSSTSPSASINGDGRAGRSDQSFDSAGDQEGGDSEGESSSRSPFQTSSGESEGDDKDSDDTATDSNANRHVRGGDTRRGRIGRPPRSRAEASANRMAKAKQPERGKSSIVSSAGRSKLDRSARIPDRHNRSSRQATGSRRQKSDSFSEAPPSSVSKISASQNRSTSGNKGGSSQRGNRGGTAINNNCGSSSASVVADVADSMDQEVDEQLYCICKQVSYGEMVGCDNNDCPMQWFHFSCVNLSTKPKGRWFCPGCRGDKPNVKRADLR